MIVKLTNRNALKSGVFDHKSPRVGKNGDDAVPLETVESLLWAGGGDNMLMLIPHSPMSHLICHLSSASCDVSAEITEQMESVSTNFIQFSWFSRCHWCLASASQWFLLAGQLNDK